MLPPELEMVVVAPVPTMFCKATMESGWPAAARSPLMVRLPAVLWKSGSMLLVTVTV